MSRTRLIAGLVFASLFAYLIAWRASEAGAAMLLAVILLGLALAEWYRPAFLVAMRKPHLSFDAIALFGLCSISAFLLLGVLDTALKPPADPFRDISDAIGSRIGWLLLIIALLVPVLPLLIRGYRNAGSRSPTPPLWPIVAGLGGGAALSVAGGFAWVTLVTPVLKPYPRPEYTALFSMFALAEAGLIGGVGAAIWLRAVSREAPERFEQAGIFPQAVNVTIGALGLAMILVATATLRCLTGPGPFDRNGLAWGGLILLFLGIAWINSLLKIRNVEPAGTISAVLAVAMLMLFFLTVLAIPAMVIEAREWVPLALVFALPLAGIASMFVLTRVPRLVRAAASR